MKGWPRRPGLWGRFRLWLWAWRGARHLIAVMRHQAELGFTSEDYEIPEKWKGWG